MNIFFINPLILSFLAFLSVPIIIMFFVNRKKIVIYWAAFEWMKKANLVRRKKVKINEILKLLAKLALILLLVFFAARPALNLRKTGNVMIIIDNTMSMQAKCDNRTRLEIARETSGKIIGKTDSAYAIYSFGGKLAPLAKLEKRQVSPKQIIDGIEIEPSWASAKDFFESLLNEAALDNVETVYFISDFQKCFWNDPEYISQSVQRLGKNKKLVFVPVDTRSEIRNISVDSIFLSPEGYFPATDCRVGVKIRNCSSVPEDAFPVTFEVNGEKCDRAYISLKPFETVTAKLVFRSEKNEDLRISVSIPADTYPADNMCHAVISPGSKLRLISASPEKGERDFRYDVFFLSALKSFCRDDYLTCKTVTPTELLSEDVDSYDMLVLSGIPLNSGSPLAGVAGRFLKSGKKGMIISSLPKEENSFLNELGFMPGQVFEGEYKLDSQKIKGTYAGFMDENDIDMDSATFFKFGVFGSSSDAEKGGRLFIKGVEDSPICLKVKGDSKILCTGLPFYPGYTDFFYNPNFVQFSMRLMSEMINRRIFFSFMGSEIRRVPAENADSEKSYSLSSGAGGESQKIELKKENGDMFFSAEPMLAGGFFSIFCDNTPVQSLGYDCSRDDSLIEPALLPEFGKAVEAGLVFNQSQDFSKQRSSMELLLPVLILLILALIFDFYAHFWRKS